MKIEELINKEYLGDCLELMKMIPDKSIDLIFTDLPYGVTQSKTDIVIPFVPLWEQYNRIIKDKGCILLFAQSVFFIDLVNSNRKMFKYEIIWDKVLTSTGLNAKIQPLRRHEQICVFRKQRGTYNPQMKEGIPLHSKGHSYMNKIPKNQNYGKVVPTEDTRKGTTEKYPVTIWRYQKPHPSICRHKTEKPVALLEEGLMTYSNPGEIVLDSCCGCGSLGEAAMNTGRNYILMENDPVEFEKMQNNIRLHKAKLNLI